MIVRLIPTGLAELKGLARSLGALFPGHDFETVPLRPNGSEPYLSFTSTPLQRGKKPDALRRLIEALAAEVHPGRARRPADLAIVVDDMELENVNQADLVVEMVRGAVEAHLDDIQCLRGSRFVDQVASALRERASFHFAVPMIETYFFADVRALEVAGVPPKRHACLVADTDLEVFQACDDEYSTDDGSACVELARNAVRQHRQPRAPWVLLQRPALPHYCRERHPKAYLQWLCREPCRRSCTTYREGEHGAEALSRLRWSEVLSRPHQSRWARALVFDVADALGCSLPNIWKGEEESLVSRSSPRPRSVLRNL